MSSSDEAVGQKRKQSADSTRPKKNRRVIDDDEGGNTFSATVTAKKSGDNVTSKLLDRFKKSGERSREQERREAERKKKEEEKPAKSKKPPAESSIPKKAGIPRKTVVEGTKKENPSLLSSLKTPPTNTSSTTSSAKVESSSSAQPLPSNHQRPPSNFQAKQRSDPPPSNKPKETNSSFDPFRPFSSPSTATVPPVAGKKPSGGLQAMLWQSLSELCAEMTKADDRPFRLVPEKPTSGIDISGSMMKYREYDWFDVDSSGSIIVKPKIPIFPEDFPPGMPEWPLAWWGIVDPALGERKDWKVMNSSGVVTDAPKVIKREAKEEDRTAEKEKESRDHRAPGKQPKEDTAASSRGNRGSSRSWDRIDSKRREKRRRGDSRERDFLENRGHRRRGDSRDRDLLDNTRGHRGGPPSSFDQRGSSGYGGGDRGRHGGTTGGPHGHSGRSPLIERMGSGPPPQGRGRKRSSSPSRRERHVDRDRGDRYGGAGDRSDRSPRGGSHDRGPPRRLDDRGPGRRFDDRGGYDRRDRGALDRDRNSDRGFERDRGGFERERRHPDERKSRRNDERRRDDERRSDEDRTRRRDLD